MEAVTGKVSQCDDTTRKFPPSQHILQKCQGVHVECPSLLTLTISYSK